MWAHLLTVSPTGEPGTPPSTPAALERRGPSVAFSLPVVICAPPAVLVGLVALIALKCPDFASLRAALTRWPAVFGSATLVLPSTIGEVSTTPLPTLDVGLSGRLVATLVSSDCGRTDPPDVGSIPDMAVEPPLLALHHHAAGVTDRARSLLRPVLHAPPPSPACARRAPSEPARPRPCRRGRSAGTCRP